MNTGVMLPVLIAALACAATMGFAIQRGATCTVAAVDELLTKRRATRLASLAEAALWVAGGLLLARSAMALPRMPPGFAITGWTIAGAVLLGLGAWVNGACVFGAIARLGSGQWAYALTPLGYWLGCLSLGTVFAPAAPHRLDGGSPVLALPFVAVLAFLAFAAWRFARLARGGIAGVGTRLWAPHMATTVIAITFLAMLLMVGAWAYTDVLAELARGMAAGLAMRGAFAVALLAGAAWGGYTAGLWRTGWPTPAQLARCLAGGALMGWGTLLIPGSNDGLILVGMPLLWPYAWLAFATMCATIAVAMLAERRIRLSRFHHGRAGDGAAS